VILAGFTMERRGMARVLRGVCPGRRDGGQLATSRCPRSRLARPPLCATSAEASNRTPTAKPCGDYPPVRPARTTEIVLACWPLWFSSRSGWLESNPYYQLGNPTQIQVPDRPDLGNRCTASDPHRPCDTKARPT